MCIHLNMFARVWCGELNQPTKTQPAPPAQVQGDGAVLAARITLIAVDTAQNSRDRQLTMHQQCLPDCFTTHGPSTTNSNTA